MALLKSRYNEENEEQEVLMYLGKMNGYMSKMSVTN